MYEVATRNIPARSVLSVKRSVEGIDAAWSFRQGGHRDPAPPVEWCRPVPADRAEQLARDMPELVLRNEPAHREAFVHVGPGSQIEPAQWQLISQSLHGWVEERAAWPSELGTRVTYLADPTTAADQGPNCDFAIAII